MRKKSESERQKPLSVAEVVTREIGNLNRTKATWTFESNRTHIAVWRGRYFNEDGDVFSRRIINFQVVSDCDVIAGGSFIEWHCSSIGFLDEFFWVADAVSQADYDTAMLLQDRWNDDFPPFDYGNVVRFERLVIKSSNRSPVVWSLISKLIEREFHKRGSLLLLKAFPLEFEGRCGHDASTNIKSRFRKRLAAMKRYYTRVLNVRAVRGSFGKQGWMWRPLRYCPPLK